MNRLEVSSSTQNAEPSALVDEPVAVADHQLDRVAGGLTLPLSIGPENLQQAATAAVHVAQDLQGICCTTTGIIDPGFGTFRGVVVT